MMRERYGQMRQFAINHVFLETVLKRLICLLEQGRFWLFAGLQALLVLR
jgi:hypothetical protein